MSNPSKDKGSRAENAAKSILNNYTKLDFKRVPLSGASHIKGDLFLVNTNNKYCIEVKHYKDDHLTSKILTNKESQFIKWWIQTIEQANKTKQEPLLIFKFDRSKFFVATLEPMMNTNFFILYPHKIYIAKLEEWLEGNEIQWIL